VLGDYIVFRITQQSQFHPSERFFELFLSLLDIFFTTLFY